MDLSSNSISCMSLDSFCGVLSMEGSGGKKKIKNAYHGFIVGMIYNCY